MLKPERETIMTTIFNSKRCVIILACAVTLCTAVALMMWIQHMAISSLTGHACYPMAVKYVETEAVVRQACGDIVTLDMTAARVKTGGSDGEACWKFKVTGSLTNGYVRIAMIMNNDIWKITNATLFLGEKRLPLLTQSNAVTYTQERQH